MASSIQQVSITDASQLEATVLQYVSQGFAVQSRTDTSVTLVKKKEFNIVVALLGFLFLLLGLIAYILYFALVEKDQVVVITVISDGVSPEPVPGMPTQAATQPQDS